ncbi:hypothetical protein OKW21_004445 [Catalinimonas alkaloidigena]|nr:hypothetical protein [Catalinimonas alkaloidigena]
MRRKNNISRINIASSLLVLYACFGSISFNCVIGICFCHSEIFNKSDTHSSVSHEIHDATHAHGDMDDKLPYDHAEKCCNEFSESLIGKELVLKDNSSERTKTSQAFLPLFILSYRIMRNSSLESDIPNIRYKYPPPKVPDIRIFIQSFLN